jgi:hypothetical protein
MTLNPWKALREAQAELTKARASADLAQNEARLARTALQEAQLRTKLADAHIINMKKQLDQAHFRNPKTGRIGRKGERFK